MTNASPRQQGELLKHTAIYDCPLLLSLKCLAVSVGRCAVLGSPKGSFRVATETTSTGSWLLLGFMEGKARWGDGEFGRSWFTLSCLRGPGLCQGSEFQRMGSKLYLCAVEVMACFTGCNTINFRHAFRLSQNFREHPGDFWILVRVGGNSLANRSPHKTPGSHKTGEPVSTASSLNLFQALPRLPSEHLVVAGDDFWEKQSLC